jgi:hypothetical protein
MRFRKLRIAWSVACIIACLLLIVLWVRSYRIADRLHGRFWVGEEFLLASKEGRVAAVVLHWHGTANWWPWKVVSYPVNDELSFPVGSVQQYVKRFGFGWLDRPEYMVMRSKQQRPDGSTFTLFGAATATLNGAGPIVPYWLLILLTSSCAIGPWIKKQFSLRTLLIATTLIAVVLGLIAWAIR